MGWIRKLLRRGRRRASSAHEVSAFQVQREIVQRVDPVLFDVGAHVGSVAKEYRRLFPGAFLHAFEPFPPSFAQLRAALAGDARVMLHPVALAATEGVARFHVNTFDATNSLLASDARGSEYWGKGLLDTRQTLEVPTTTLDAFCTREGVDRIDVLKLDVQGAELSVLEGGRRMLAEQRVGLVYAEIILAPTYQGQQGLDAYMNLFAAHDYRLFALYNPVLRRRRWIQSDVLFASSRCLDEYERRVP